MGDEYKYAGSELEIFRTAVNWKDTLKKHIQTFVSGDVLEVGAGLGGTTRVFCTGLEDSWTCLEPDVAMARVIENEFSSVKVVAGPTESICPDQLFDTILYIDVLEHIEDDFDEVRKAIKHLKPNGYLVVLVPAHQWLYSKFDQAIGHFRRYDLNSMKKLTQSGMKVHTMHYLDSVGLLASAANKLFLSQKYPTPNQIKFWDGYLVKLSRFLDPLIRFKLGKSLLAVWKREA